MNSYDMLIPVLSSITAGLPSCLTHNIYLYIKYRNIRIKISNSLNLNVDVHINKYINLKKSL